MTISVAAESLGPQTSPSSRPSAKTFAEFFAGIGLVDEGLRKSGWRCLYSNDNDVRKMRMHADRNGVVPEYHLGDVRDAEQVVSRINGEPFLATASFPCVDLSTAGNYQGFQGQHSSTFFAFVDVLKMLGTQRPKLVMLENVVGFLSSRGGEDFATAATTLAELGYWLDAFVLDARHFVPQSRPRVFVIGMADELRPARTHARNLIGALDVEPSALRPAAIVHFIRSLPLATGWAPLDLGLPPLRKIELADVIDLDDGQEWWDEPQVERHCRMMSESHRRRIDELLKTKSKFVGTIFRRVRKDGQRAEVRFDGLAGCLRTPRGGSGRQIVIALQDERIRMRWMSPREYGRLQGVPDFPLKGAANPLLLGFADAVCVPVIEWIDRAALTPLYDAHHSLHNPDHARQSHA